MNMWENRCMLNLQAKGKKQKRERKKGKGALFSHTHETSPLWDFFCAREAIFSHFFSFSFFLFGRPFISFASLSFFHLLGPGDNFHDGERRGGRGGGGGGGGGGGLFGALRCFCTVLCSVPKPFLRAVHILPKYDILKRERKCFAWLTL